MIAIITNVTRLCGCCGEIVEIYLKKHYEGRFRIENDRGGRSWNWSEFSTWMESPHFFHLYFNSRSFFIVPKDAFEGDDEHEARKILKAKIGQK